MKYHIRLKFECENEPPAVLIVNERGHTIAEVFEAPTLKVPQWSWNPTDWELGPMARSVVEALGAQQP